MSAPIAGDLTNTLRQNHTRSNCASWILPKVSPSAPRFTLTSWRTFGQTTTYNYFIMQWETQHLLHHMSKTTADHIAFSKIWFGHRFGYLWPFSILNLKRCINLKLFDPFWSIQLSVSWFSFSSYQLWHSTSLPLTAAIITHQLLAST